jgi:hypothetical protein
VSHPFSHIKLAYIRVPLLNATIYLSHLHFNLRANSLTLSQHLARKSSDRYGGAECVQPTLAPRCSFCPASVYREKRLQDMTGRHRRPRCRERSRQANWRRTHNEKCSSQADFQQCGVSSTYVVFLLLLFIPTLCLSHDNYLFPTKAGHKCQNKSLTSCSLSINYTSRAISKAAQTHDARRSTWLHCELMPPVCLHNERCSDNSTLPRTLFNHTYIPLIAILPWVSSKQTPHPSIDDK